MDRQVIIHTKSPKKLFSRIILIIPEIDLTFKPLEGLE